ncbi:alpha/beta hydrolase [Amycolatopsis anabasis]|uniref:alpha/beta hydrolase n=1 Tax=Amycolatopsis anabasis TaxID=1840409 RepID=UPI001FE5F359|nr:alpha/beta hydrolase [Amycolatopsis anabasis]
MADVADQAVERATEPAARPAPPVVEHRGRGSRRSRVLALFLRVFVRPVLVAYGRFPHLPWPFGLIDRLAFWMRSLPGTERAPVALPDCRAEWIQARKATGNRVVLYLHGGAFICCGLRTHRRLVSEISAAGRCPVLTVDYRMLPRAPISSSVTDGVHGFRWLLDQGFRPEEIVVAGDSAGGFLAFQVALAVVQRRLGTPAAVVALSPLTDLDPARKCEHPNASLDPVFPTSVLSAVADLAAKTEARVFVDGSPGPALSPVDADLGELPPVLIQAGSTEMLLPDSELMADRLAAAGVGVTLQIWDRQVHVFQAAADLVPEGRAAIREIGTFLRQAAP